MSTFDDRVSDGEGFRMTGPSLSTSPEARKVLREQGVAAWSAWVKAQTAAATPANESTEPPGKGEWPGWEVDQAATDAAADRLIDAVTASFDPAAVAAAWLASDTARAAAEAAETPEEVPEEVPAAPVPPPSPAAAWAVAQGVAIIAATQAAVPAAIVDGALIGARAAAAVIDGITVVDWSDWTPGDEDAARKILGRDGRGEGLARMLADSEVRLYGIGANRLERFARVLADAAAAGDSVDTLAKKLGQFSSDRTWAYVTAQTELARAVSQATLDTYVDNGIERHEWSISGPDPNDQVRVCEVCLGNAAVGPIAVGAKFPSGETAPPGHPRCRCALIPVIDLDETTAAPPWMELLAETLLPVPADLVESDDDGRQRLKRYWIAGVGASRWTTFTDLRKHLRKHLPPAILNAVTARWYHDRYGRWPGRRKRDT